MSAAPDRVLQDPCSNEFETLVSNLPDVVFRLDRELRHVFISPIVERWTGIAPRDFIGKTGRELGIDAAACDAFEAAARRVLSGGPPETVVFRDRGRTFRCRIAPERDASERVVSLLGITDDITGAVTADAALRASEARARIVQDNVSDHLIVLEPVRGADGAVTDWIYVDANAHALELVGTPLVGKSIRDVLGAERARARHASLLGVLETGQPFRYEVSFRGRDLVVTLFRLDEDHVASASVDITDLRRAEDRAASIARFPEENPDPVLRIGPEGEILYANPSARERVGCGAPGPAPAPLRELAEKARVERRRLTAEVAIGDAAFSTTVVPVGREVNVYAHDITERKRAESALREADQRKNEFLALLSHELRNPLAAIQNAVSLLGRANASGDAVVRAHTVIGRQVHQLSRLVEDILDLTRITRGKVQVQTARLDLGAIVRQTVADHRQVLEGRRIALELAAPADTVFVDGDAARLSQVIGNLLQNAAKFTDEGGHVRVSLEASGADGVLAVQDDGAGIAPEMLPSLFQPFTQAERTLHRTRGGLGLGLSLVKAIIGLHGGTVEAHSEGVGRGARFVVRLPLAPPSGDLARTTPAVATAPGGRRRVLVVDDNSDAATTMRDLLELEGHEVILARDGREALHAAALHHPDLVLCDIGLPTLDGYEVARRLREHGNGAVLVALTGYAMPGDAERARAAGFQHHVAKPVQFVDLSKILASVPPVAR